MFSVTLLPLFGVHLLNHGLVDVIDKSPECAHRVLRYLSKEHLLVTGGARVYDRAGLRISHEENALAAQFCTMAY